MKLGTATCRDGTVEAEIEVDGTAYCLRYSAAGLSSDDAADALLAAALPRIQGVFRPWRQRYPVYGQYQRVAIDAPVRAAPLFPPGHRALL